MVAFVLSKQQANQNACVLAMLNIIIEFNSDSMNMSRNRHNVQLTKIWVLNAMIKKSVYGSTIFSIYVISQKSFIQHAEWELSAASGWNPIRYSFLLHQTKLTKSAVDGDKIMTEKNLINSEQDTVIAWCWCVWPHFTVTLTNTFFACLLIRCGTTTSFEWETCGKWLIREAKPSDTQS